MGKTRGSKKRKGDGICVTLDCRCSPHGYYALVPAMLASMAFLTSAFQDGCDYAILQGNSVELISQSNVLPYLEVGLAQYRAPLYYPTSGNWKTVYTEDCLAYGEEPNGLWNAAVWLSFCSNVIGGGLAMFLWCTTCFTLSRRTWKFCGVQAILSGILRAGGLFFFFSHICKQDDSSCGLYFGSQMDIAGVVLWLMCGFSICGHYPDPKLRKMTTAEMEAELARQAVEEDRELAPKRLSSLNPSASMGSGGGIASDPAYTYDARGSQATAYYDNDDEGGDDQYYDGQSYYEGSVRSRGGDAKSLHDSYGESYYSGHTNNDQASYYDNKSERFQDEESYGGGVSRTGRYHDDDDPYSHNQSV